MKNILLFIICIHLTCDIYSQTVDCNKVNETDDINYLDGSKTPFSGTCVLYYSNGKKSFEAQYKNGRTCGTCKWYYDNGQIKEQVTYALDKENKSVVDGTTTKWFKDGKTNEVINYKAGYYDGEWYELDKNGKTIKKGLYKDNKLISGDKYIAPSK